MYISCNLYPCKELCKSSHSNKIVTFSVNVTLFDRFIAANCNTHVAFIGPIVTKIAVGQIRKGDCFSFCFSSFDLEV